MMLRTIAILRGSDPHRAVDLAERCWAQGFDLVEVTVQDERGWAAFEAVSRIAAGRAFGAGTVLTPQDARRAVSQGASVIVSPGLDPDVVHATYHHGATPLPGVMTPSEVSTAARLGLHVCKLFPATVLGASWLRAMKGPFPTMNFIAVGGITAANADEFIKAGATGVAFGSSIEYLLTENDLSTFITNVHQLADNGVYS